MPRWDRWSYTRGCILLQGRLETVAPLILSASLLCSALSSLPGIRQHAYNGLMCMSEDVCNVLNMWEQIENWISFAPPTDDGVSLSSYLREWCVMLCFSWTFVPITLCCFIGNCKSLWKTVLLDEYNLYWLSCVTNTCHSRYCITYQRRVSISHIPRMMYISRCAWTIHARKPTSHDTSKRPHIMRSAYFALLLYLIEL